MKPHLPRPRIVRALLDAAFLPGGPNTIIDSQPTPRGLTPPQISAHTNFENFAKLERAVCYIPEGAPTTCGKPGCEKQAEAKCSICQDVKYCSKECQTA